MKRIRLDNDVNTNNGIKTHFVLRLGLSLCFLASAFALAQGQAQENAAAGISRVVTVAGGVVNDGKPATSAGLILPRFAALDKKGDLYLPDAQRIRKVNSKTGVISTIAGDGISGFSGDGGPAKQARMMYPVGIVFDAQGNLLFSDQGTNRVRKIDIRGIISTIAGNGEYGFGGDGGPATAASLANPFGLVMDAAGNLYICDVGSNRVRMVDKQGIITTVAGNGTPGYDGDGGPATQASLNFPYAAIVDYGGNLYIADYNNLVVRKVDPQGTITTFAGNGGNGCNGDGGPATQAKIGAPGGFAFAAGALLISGNGCAKVRAVDLGTNMITTVAGSGAGYDGDGNPALATKFRGQRGLLFDSTGSLLIADRGNQRIRRLDSNTNIVTTIAGGVVGDGGKGTGASLGAPNSISYHDVTGVLYIADTSHDRVRALSPTGTIMTVAGTGITGYDGDGGPATQARLNGPEAVAVDR